jgi:aryl-alcohol dehydrogenase-like predicted oxidoreductase
LDRFPLSWSPRYLRPEIHQACRLYQNIADDYQMSLTQLALAFCYSSSKVDSCIVGCTSIEQLQECLAAQTVCVDEEILRRIDRVRWAHRDPAQ